MIDASLEHIYTHTRALRLICVSLSFKNFRNLLSNRRSTSILVPTLYSFIITWMRDEEKSFLFNLLLRNKRAEGVR